jgi:hypothetical protein
VISERLDRLAALRGDPVKGLPQSAWATNLEGVDRDLLLSAAIEATRALVLQDWADKRPTDRRPQAALEAAEAWIKTKSPEAIADAKAAAKECTAARSETFGYDNRIAEAARACAWAVAAKDNEHIYEALSAVEEELLARVALVGEYHRVPEQRKAILAVLRKVLVPPPVAATPSDTGPVPYAASGSFAVGQRLVHAKFGDVVVKAATPTTIDVELPDGTTKRLAHKGK